MAIAASKDDFGAGSVKSSKLWDRVASNFRPKTSCNSIYAPGADNFNAVWPILYQVICRWQPKNTGYRVCDFGCGTGILAEQLDRLKFRTYACDISQNMIAQARLLSRGNVVYEIGGYDFVNKYSPFQLITAIMVFQFIENLDTLINTLAHCLVKDGLLFFAVHNMEYVRECEGYGLKFRGVDNKTVPAIGEILIDTTWIKTYIRSPEWYDDLLSSMGLYRVGYALRGNTPPLDVSTELYSEWLSSKYYIAWYKK